jgi:putative Holliday junction resolvase
MRVMALDYGTHAIGVAVSDELQWTVRPLTTLRRQGQSPGAILSKIAELVQEYEPAALVIGLPLRMDGTVGDAAERVQRFIADVRSTISIPVLTQDERLTSREADEMMREEGLDARTRRARSDEYAAAIILRDYLASRPVPSPAANDNDLD